MKRPMIVVEERETGAIFAHMCSQKGPGDRWIVRRIGKDLKEMGFGGTRIILKCDQENPIAAVQQEVIKNRPDVATVPRHSPVGESQSNGRVENAIRRVQEQVRAFYDQLKARTGVLMGTDHVNGIYPAPDIHEHYTIHKGYGTLRISSRTTSTILSAL